MQDGCRCSCCGANPAAAKWQRKSAKEKARETVREMMSAVAAGGAGGRGDQKERRLSNFEVRSWRKGPCSSMQIAAWHLVPQVRVPVPPPTSSSYVLLPPPTSSSSTLLFLNSPMTLLYL